jgi:hypothetical protein
VRLEITFCYEPLKGQGRSSLKSGI